MPPEDTATSALLDGRYELGACVGQGAMARVYRAEDVVLGRTVAVKLMRGDADALASPARARTEMALLASLNHPSLVTLYDACIVPGRPEYLVMEFVDGESLASELQRGPLPPEDVVSLAAELASALHVVHAAGVVHRDVKPANVLLAPDPLPTRRHRAKLADFGIAYLADSARLTSPGLVVGTAAYLAPEQIRGEAGAPPVDIYALGLVLLESLTGERAFPGASGIGAVMARLIDDPVVPACVGPQWTALLSAMTASDPSARPSALDVLHAVADLPTDILRPPTDAAAAAASMALTPTVTMPPIPATAALSRTVPVRPSPRAAPTLPFAPARLPGHAPDGPSGGSEATRRGRRRELRRRRTLVGSVAGVVAVLIVSAALWAGGQHGGMQEPPTTDPDLVTPSPSVSLAAEDDVAPTEEAAVPAGTVEEGGSPADQRAADKAAEAAQRAADKAARDAEKTTRGKAPGP